MKVCYFGTYDENFTKNKFIIRALELNGVEVLKVHRQIGITEMNKLGHFSASAVVNRALAKLTIVPAALANLGRIRSCDAILVGYPGHFDIPLAALVSKATRVPLYFDPVLILTLTFTQSVRIMKKSDFAFVLLRAFERFIYRLPKLIFVETELMKSFFVANFQILGKKIAVLPLGADDDVYRQIKPKTGRKKPFVITYYGMYIAIHGIDVIVKAAALLRNHKDIEFQLIGRGPLYAQTEAEVRKKNLTNVTFLPDITEKTARPFLEKSNVFLGFLAKSDIVNRTIPNKVYQGLALGVATITADTEAARHQFINGTNIVLIPPQSPKHLAEAILNLKNNTVYASKIAEKGAVLFKKEYSPKAIGKTLIQLLQTR